MTDLAEILSNALQKTEVWEKGHPIPGYDPSIWRFDDERHVLRKSDHGDRSSEYGWEIDHIVPVSQGGSNDLANLRPLNCFSNASHGGRLSHK